MWREDQLETTVDMRIKDCKTTKFLEKCQKENDFYTYKTKGNNGRFRSRNLNMDYEVDVDGIQGFTLFAFIN